MHPFLGFLAVARSSEPPPNPIAERQQRRERHWSRRSGSVAIALTALTALDPEAAALVRRWTAEDGATAFGTVELLARHVLGVDSFFEWSSDRDPVAM